MNADNIIVLIFGNQESCEVHRSNEVAHVVTSPTGK